MTDIKVSLKLLVKTVLVFEEQSEPGTTIDSRTGFCNSLGRLMQARNIRGFKAHTLESYFTEIKKGNFTGLEKSKKITDALALFATGKKYLEFQNDPPEVTQDQADRVLKLLKLDPHPDGAHAKLSANFIEISELNKLQQEENVEVSVITCSLEWLDDNLPENIERIKNTNNEYRYIVTEDLERVHLVRIKGLLNDNKEIKDRIRIKTMYNSAAVNIEEIEGIRIPISNDIVIFRQRKTKDSRYEFKIAVVSNSTTADEKYVLKIQDKRASDILRWFEVVWQRLAPLDYDKAQ